MKRLRAALDGLPPEPVGAPPQPATQGKANARHVSVMPPPATVMLLRLCCTKLVEIDALSHMVHGNIIETYKERLIRNGR